MKKDYIVPKATIACVNGQEEILKPWDFVGGSLGAKQGSMGAKERVGDFDDSVDDFWSTKSDE